MDHSDAIVSYFQSNGIRNEFALGKVERKTFAAELSNALVGTRKLNGPSLKLYSRLKPKTTSNESENISIEKPAASSTLENDEKDASVTADSVTSDIDLESVVEQTLHHWNRSQLDGQRMKECLLSGNIKRSTDIETLTVGSEQWESVRNVMGLNELEALYLLNRLKVITSGWTRGNEVRSVSECNRMELLYVLVAYILPNETKIKDQGMTWCAWQHTTAYKMLFGL